MPISNLHCETTEAYKLDISLWSKENELVTNIHKHNDKINPSISTCEWNPQEHAGKQSGNSYLLHFCKLQDIFQKKHLNIITGQG